MTRAPVEARAYWVVEPGRGELRSVVLPERPPPGTSRVRTEYGSVSPGTERLVGLGLVPAALAGRMACRGMEGTFALPVKYGYCVVGTVVAGAATGRRVFAMHPHQDLADIADADLVELPVALPAARAVLVPNLETALNGVWDAELREGERAVVVGAGVVGLLTAYCLAALHGVEPVVVEATPERRRTARTLPFVHRVLAPDEVEAGTFAVAFHASGTPGGLQTALDAVGFEGRVVDLTWYGTQRVELDLGTTFHCQRKRILASQVAVVAPAMRATHGPRERLAEVLRLLGDPHLDALLGAPRTFADLPLWMPDVYARRLDDIVPLVVYPAARPIGEPPASGSKGKGLG